MRRVQPNCVNIILTGYPAFENALRAIRAQVDDFLVKPADVPTLVELIERKLAEPEKLHNRCNQRLSDCLRERTEDISRRALGHMKANPRLAEVPLSDQERIDHIKEMIKEILAELEHQPKAHSGAGLVYGRRRRQQGYSLAMLVDDRRAVDMAIYDVVREKLLDIDLSTLLNDLSRLNDSLDSQLQQSLTDFIGADA
jgi:YesN/AraC family two-component response regulator